MSKFEKRKLIFEWASKHDENHLHLFEENSVFNKRNAIQRITIFADIFENSIYLLLANIQGVDTPIYVGKSKRPFARWKQHISGFESGKATYSKWRGLLVNGNDVLNFDVKLLIVPERKILFPPISDFPITIGAVEYQLVSLISDAFPETLLNSEGNRR